MGPIAFGFQTIPQKARAHFKNLAVYQRSTFQLDSVVPNLSEYKFKKITFFGMRHFCSFLGQQHNQAGFQHRGDRAMALQHDEGLL